MPRRSTSEFDAIATARLADRYAIPAADLVFLFRAIDRHRKAGLRGRHRHRSLLGCDAVALWANGRGATGDDRPGTAFFTAAMANTARSVAVAV